MSDLVSPVSRPGASEGIPYRQTVSPSCAAHIEEMRKPNESSPGSRVEIAPPSYSREEFERDRMGETGERNAASRRGVEIAHPAPSGPDFKAQHMAHCNQGENIGGCKYGDDDCPAMREAAPPAVEGLRQLMERVRAGLPQGDGRWETVCDTVCRQVLAALSAPSGGK